MTYEFRYGDDAYAIDMTGRAAQALDHVMEAARRTGMLCGLSFKSSPSPESVSFSWNGTDYNVHAMPSVAAALRSKLATSALGSADVVDTAHAKGVEATLRARIATLEENMRVTVEANKRFADENIRLRSERNSFNVRDQRMCERIQKAETRIRELEAEGAPALIGQRNAWRDIAQKLNVILCNQDPSHG